MGRTAWSRPFQSCCGRRSGSTCSGWRVRTTPPSGSRNRSTTANERLRRSLIGDLPRTGRTGQMQRGEIWFAATPGGDRPVLVLTRDPVAARTGSVVVAALTRHDVARPRVRTGADLGGRRRAKRLRRQFRQHPHRSPRSAPSPGGRTVGDEARGNVWSARSGDRLLKGDPFRCSAPPAIRRHHSGAQAPDRRHSGRGRLIAAAADIPERTAVSV